MRLNKQCTSIEKHIQIILDKNIITEINEV